MEQHGVPPEHTEERAVHGLSKIGADKIQEALNAKNQWSALKYLASMPRYNMLWVKPMELDAQIKRRAQAKFKVHPSQKRKGRNNGAPSMPDIDPQQLELIPGSFVKSDGTAALQIPMTQVGSNRAGIAFARTQEVLPLLPEGKSLTLDGLAILTTAPVPADAQGLLPAQHIRFPALFAPTQEPLLIEGSLVQLGDESIVRATEDSPVKVAAVETVTIKVSLFRDQWKASWDDLQSAPVKTIISAFPAFILCNGIRCGGVCQRFHPPLECELDSVVLDVWARTWQNMRGQRTDAKSADVFNVMMRVPREAYKGIQSLTGQAGLYVEPRSDDGRSPLSSTTVLWLPHGSFEDADLKMRTTEKALSIARHGHRYGVRVPTADAASIHQKLMPDQPFQNFQVQKIYEIRPLAHGIQRNNVAALLQGWNWKAKPLQATRSDAQGAGWLVGAEEEPSSVVLSTSSGDVTVTLQKEMTARRPPPGILASKKTQQHLKKQDKHQQHSSLPGGSSSSSSGQQALPPADPWATYDPWSRYKGTHCDQKKNGDVDMVPHSKQQEIEDSLRGELKDELHHALESSLLESLQQKNDTRFSRLETDMQELRSQGHKFESWFADAAAANAQMQSQVQDIQQELSGQKVHTQNLTDEIRAGFSNIKAMFDNMQHPMEAEGAKRQRDA